MRRGTPWRGRRGSGDHGYKPPGKDSVKARASAIQLLTCARNLDNITVDQLVRSYQLKPATAERMLAEERARRERML